MNVDYIKNILKINKNTFSFEFFPPKTEEGYKNLRHTIATLKDLNPDFISVTYGAGGSTRQKTNQLVREIQEDFGLISMAHLTCVNSNREDIYKILEEHRNSGIKNIMALRGDPPQGQTTFFQVENGFRYANELISFIKEFFGDTFSLGAAAYPEKHPEASSLEEDIKHLKMKMDAGADFLVTQLFFDNQKFLYFRDKIEREGIRIPLLAGIMPITSFQQVEKFTRMANCSIPEEFLKNVEKYKDTKEDLQKYSVEYAVRQCIDLIKNDVKGIHFYTLNQSDATFKILTEIYKQINIKN